MSSSAGPWLLYGAYGYTGKLLAAEAVARGHRPILAGRNGETLRRLAGELGAQTPGSAPLPTRVLSLDDPEVLRRGIRDAAAVLHAAGPFVDTGRPMMDACLAEGVHYLDITGEVPVFEEAFARDGAARQRGIVLMPGVGMDVVPTDGVAALLARALPGARRLELALHSPGGASAGTMQTILEGIPRGLRVRRGGQLVGASPGAREFRRRVDFGPAVTDGTLAGRLGGVRWVAPFTWGDLSTAWRTTGIPDITCYMATSRSQLRLLPVALPVLRAALSIDPLRRFLRAGVARGPAGPDTERLRTGRVRVWGRVEDGRGGSAEMVIETPQGYRFTALAGVRAVEEVLRLGPAAAGTQTPAGAFGPRWVLGLRGVEVVVGPPAPAQEPGPG